MALINGTENGNETTHLMKDRKNFLIIFGIIIGIIIIVWISVTISNAPYKEHAGEYFSSSAASDGRVRKFVFLESKSGYYEINGVKYWFTYKISNDYVTMDVDYNLPAYNGYFINDEYKPDNRNLQSYTYKQIYDFSD